jgi:two-component system sensor histidine kinase UhpB
VRICAEADPTALQLTVEDDGTGLPDDWARRGHYGLRGLRERAATLGGRLSVQRRLEGGTRVQAWLPLHHDQGDTT